MIDLSKLSLDEKEPEKLNYAKVFDECLIDLEVVPDRPPLAISIGLDEREYKGVRYPLRFGTFGNISMIKGEEKARKSFLKSMILSCAIGGKANNYASDIRGHDLSDQYIFDIDTEQDDYDVWLNASRIPKMVGIIPDNYKSIKLRSKTPSERLEFLDWLFLESEYRNNMGIVSLDGYVDFLKNFNDLEECNLFVQKLMKYSSVCKTHITGVLHLNPGSTKARGHLGTLLQNKCETVVIIKDAGEYSEVICQRARGKKFQDFTIRVNDDWLPYISEDEVGVSGDSNVKFF